MDGDYDPEKDPQAPPHYYISEKEGDDVKGNGTKKFPFKTCRRLLESLRGDLPPTAQILIDGTDGERWMRMSNTRMKKCLKNYRLSLNKAGNLTKPCTSGDAGGASSAATAVKITEDMSLPTATRAKIRDLGKCIGERVQVFGWAH
uniref:SUI1 domain-containing protein n=1 Tax=Mesocestoides corti TaxID=53468 RepID=A0A5K3G7M1_MESCO